MESPRPFRDMRPWGEELWVIDGKEESRPAMVKILIVKPGEILSLQYHRRRDELWHVLEGGGAATIGDETFPVSKGQEFFAPRMTKHLLEAGQSGLTVLELGFGDFDEDDIVRLKDKYGRVPKK